MSARERGMKTVNTCTLYHFQGMLLTPISSCSSAHQFPTLGWQISLSHVQHFVFVLVEFHNIPVLSFLHFIEVSVNGNTLMACPSLVLSTNLVRVYPISSSTEFYQK